MLEYNTYLKAIILESVLDNDFYFSEEDKKLWCLVGELISNSKFSIYPICGADVDLPVIQPANKNKFGVSGHREISLGAVDGIDGNQQRRMDGGFLSIDYTIDLHGMSKMQALGAFEDAIMSGYQQGWRLLLVITGIGKRSAEKGVLRQEVLSWVNLPHLAAKIIRISQATKRHGGLGAFYILIKRRKQ